MTRGRRLRFWKLYLEGQEVIQDAQVASWTAIPAPNTRTLGTYAGGAANPRAAGWTAIAAIASMPTVCALPPTAVPAGTAVAAGASGPVEVQDAADGRQPAIGEEAHGGAIAAVTRVTAVAATTSRSDPTVTAITTGTGRAAGSLHAEDDSAVAAVSGVSPVRPPASGAATTAVTASSAGTAVTGHAEHEETEATTRVPTGATLTSVSTFSGLAELAGIAARAVGQIHRLLEWDGVRLGCGRLGRRRLSLRLCCRGGGRFRGGADAGFFGSGRLQVHRGGISTSQAQTCEAEDARCPFQGRRNHGVLLWMRSAGGTTCLGSAIGDRNGSSVHQ